MSKSPWSQSGVLYTELILLMLLCEVSYQCCLYCNAWWWWWWWCSGRPGYDWQVITETEAGYCNKQFHRAETTSSQRWLTVMLCYYYCYCNDLFTGGGFMSAELVTKVNAFLTRLKCFVYLSHHIAVCEITNKSNDELFHKITHPGTQYIIYCHLLNGMII